MRRGNGMDIPDWDDLRVFLAVARAESLSGAGRILRLDPATVGRRIARLEEGLGVPLFLKSPQGYALTEEGSRLLAQGVRAEQVMADAIQEVRGEPGRISGTIRVGAPDGCANYLLPQVTAAIAAENSGLEVQIVALPRVFNLSKREADMAVAVSRPDAGRVTVQKVTDYQLHLAAARDWLARHGPIRSLADLRGLPLIGYIPDMIFDREIDYLSEIGAEVVTFGSNSVSVQFNWVRQGAGVGVVHDFAIPSDPQVVRVLPEAFGLTRSFWLIRHGDDRRVERLSRFADRLITGLRREVARLEGLAAG